MPRQARESSGTGIYHVMMRGISWRQDLFRRFKRYGIYEWEHIYKLCGGEKDEDIRALKFSHTELFKRPVSYATAQQVLAKNGYKTPNTFAGPMQVNKDVFFDMYEMGK